MRWVMAQRILASAGVHMLKGLLLRQSFIAVDVVMVVVLSVVLFRVLGEIMVDPVDPGTVSSPGKPGATVQAAFAKTRDRSTYDVILSRGLFGQAAKFESAQATTPKEPETISPDNIAEETELPLTLFATVSSKIPLAAAIIEVREGSVRTDTFYLNEEIIDRVFLREVRKKEVILENQRTNRLENLELSQSQTPVNPRTASRITSRINRASGSRAAPASSTRGLITLKRADTIKRMEDTYARLASTLNVRVVKDDTGRVKGVTTDNIESIEMANEFGFKNGDVLASINNEPVDSREKAVEILERYRNASIFRIGIIRGGRPMYINYRLQ